MNPNQIQIEAQDTSIVTTKDRLGESSPGAKIEPREFENLLQRAMEILIVRAQSAAPSNT
jgi:hypothetical protein